MTSVVHHIATVTIIIQDPISALALREFAVRHIQRRVEQRQPRVLRRSDVDDMNLPTRTRNKGSWAGCGGEMTQIRVSFHPHGSRPRDLFTDATDSAPIGMH